MVVYVILDERSSATHPLGEAVETFIRREDAERFIEDVRGDDPETRELPADRGARGGRAKWPIGWTTVRMARFSAGLTARAAGLIPPSRSSRPRGG